MKVVIVHGSNARDREKVASGALPQNERGWIGWIREELEKREVECVAPLFPNNWAPVYEEWKEEFEKIEISDEDILVGMSAGSAFLLRYLGESKKKIGRLILIAPAILCGEGIEYLKEFKDFVLDESIKSRVDKIICFTSDNDRSHFIEGANIIEDKLNSQLIEMKGYGHFTVKSMGSREFPELLEEVLR